VTNNWSPSLREALKHGVFQQNLILILLKKSPYMPESF